MGASSVFRSIRLFVAAGLVAVLFAPALSAQAEDTGIADNASWIMPGYAGSGPAQGALFMEPTIGPNSISELYPTQGGKRVVSPDAVWCSSMQDPTCANAEGAGFQAYIPPCSESAIVDCVAELWAVVGDSRTVATFDRSIPSAGPIDFTGDAVMRLPNGGSPGIWRFPGLTHDGGSDAYALSAILTGVVARSGTSWRATTTGASVVLDPVTVVSDGQASIRLDPKMNNNDPSIFGYLTAGETIDPAQQYGYCALAGDGKCARRANPPAGVRFGITLRLSNAPAAWVHGRIWDPTFTVQESGTATLWTVEAGTIRLPVASGWLSVAQYNRISSEHSYCVTQCWKGPLNSQVNAFDEFLRWLPTLGDKASAMQSRWSFRTLSTASKETQDCMQNAGVIGTVVTNATVYQNEPPVWSKTTATLDYHVGAPHYDASGNVFRGYYQMRLKRSVAQCLYHLTNAPVHARVSVVSEGGNEIVATESVVNLQDWVVLTAANFTYSSPTLKVSLYQDAPVATPSASASPSTSATPAPAVTATKSTAAIPKSKTITCVKGKTTKKVTAVQPKCPLGYKQK